MIKVIKYITVLAILLITAVLSEPACANERTKPIINCSTHKNNATVCLACNIYHEARGEPIHGRILTAKTVLNRVHDEEFPKTVCNVVWQKSQYSWTLSKNTRVYERDSWEDALSLSRMMLAYGDHINIETNKNYCGVTHFHKTTIKRPLDFKGLDRIGVVGTHVWYRKYGVNC